MLANEQEIEKELEPLTISGFFATLKEEVNAYYEV